MILGAINVHVTHKADDAMVSLSMMLPVIKAVVLSKLLDSLHDTRVLVAGHGGEQMVFQLVLHAAPEPLAAQGSESIF